jgi:hypothetical protein
MNWRDLDGSGRGIIEALSGGTGENHEYFGGGLLVGRNSKLGPSECKRRVTPPEAKSLV